MGGRAFLLPHLFDEHPPITGIAPFSKGEALGVFPHSTYGRLAGEPDEVVNPGVPPPCAPMLDVALHVLEAQALQVLRVGLTLCKEDGRGDVDVCGGGEGVWVWSMGM